MPYSARIYAARSAMGRAARALAYGGVNPPSTTTANREWAAVCGAAYDRHVTPAQIREVARSLAGSTRDDADLRARLAAALFPLGWDSGHAASPAREVRARARAAMRAAARLSSTSPPAPPASGA